MPRYVDPQKTALQSIEQLQALIRSSAFNDRTKYPDRNRIAIYAAIFALRASVNSLPGQMSSLEVQNNAAAFTARHRELVNDPVFTEFAVSMGDNAMREGLCTGHGGMLEQEFRKFVKRQKTLPTGLHSRFMPTGEERVDYLKEELKGQDPSSKEAAATVAEIFRARRAVGAIKGGKGNALSQNIDPRMYGAVPDIEGSSAFKSFMEEHGEEVTASITKKGHGGEAESMFLKHVAQMDKIPVDTPDIYMPTVKERTDAIKEKLSEPFYGFGENESIDDLCIEVLAARSSSNVKCGEKSELGQYLDPKKLAETAAEYKKCETLKNFIASDPEAAKRAASEGNGSALEEAFRKHVRELVPIPADIPARYIPTAKERTEGLMTKIKGRDFAMLDRDEQLGVYAELMAARMSVGAVRKDESSLNAVLDPEKVKTASDSLANNETFKSFIESSPAKVREAATSGHAGALEDAFKEYVLDLDHIPADIPDRYMPSALKRTEVLKSKIKADSFVSSSPERKAALYKELMATRMAVNSKRGSADSLDVPIKSEKLGKAMESLNASENVKSFLEDSEPEVLREAATDGHGGALEDKMRTSAVEDLAANGTLPNTLPRRYQPTASAAFKEMKANLKYLSTHRGANYFDWNKNIVMTKVAAMMYLTKVNMQKGSDASKQAKMDPEKMAREINVLKNSKEFKSLFDKPGGPQRMVDLAANNTTRLFTELAEARNSQAAQRQPQQQLEHQQEHLLA